MDSNEEEFSPDEDRILKEREMFRDELVRALGKRTEEPEPVAGVNMELQNMQTSEGSFNFKWIKRRIFGSKWIKSDNFYFKMVMIFLLQI